MLSIMHNQGRNIDEESGEKRKPEVITIILQKEEWTVVDELKSYKIIANSNYIFYFSFMWITLISICVLNSNLC